MFPLLTIDAILAHAKNGWLKAPDGAVSTTNEDPLTGFRWVVEKYPSSLLVHIDMLAGVVTKHHVELPAA